MHCTLPNPPTTPIGVDKNLSGSLKWFLRCRCKALWLCVNDCVINWIATI
ncbi:MAG: hypothetical protein J6W29_02800 [Neisseriaceae bacterium]|nr:hypothetical protein [Neisseriaceae bacterium]